MQLNLCRSMIFVYTFLPDFFFCIKVGWMKIHMNESNLMMLIQSLTPPSWRFPPTFREQAWFLSIFYCAVSMKQCTVRQYYQLCESLSNCINVNVKNDLLLHYDVIFSFALWRCYLIINLIINHRAIIKLTINQIWLYSHVF